MKTTKTGWMMAAALAALVAAAVPAWAVSFAERDVAKKAVGEAQAELAGAEILRGKAITLLPVHGDEEGYLEELLLHSMVKSGLTAVIPNDERDARFRRILKEIRWDEEQMRLETVDPETIDELGHLLSTQVLLEGRLMKSRLPVMRDRKGRPVGWAGADGAGAVEMELHLFAYEIRTKRYVWSMVAAAKEEPAGPDGGPEERGPSFRWFVDETAVPLNAGVKVENRGGAGRVADELETWIAGRLADLGYRLETGKDDDLTLTLEVESEVYDRTGEYETHRGELKATLEARGTESRLLGTQGFNAKGKPGEGAAGARNLAYDLEEQLGAWLKRTLDPDALGFAAVRMDFMLASPVETGGDYEALEAIRKAIAEMDGVRWVELAAQDNGAGMVSYKVLYDTAAYPGGLANALFAEHAELLDKYLD